MREGEPLSLRGVLGHGSGLGGRTICGMRGEARLEDLLQGSILGGRLPELAGRSVLLKAKDQFAAALALIELDGVARRIVLCPMDLPPDQLPALIANAEADALISDDEDADRALPISLQITCSDTMAPAGPAASERRDTEWVLLTSGTTGVPKMVVHDLAGLTDAIKPRTALDPGLVWGTFYDIRRFGGLQIYFRALLGGGSLVLSGAGEPAASFLERLRSRHVTHLSGTPSHWRRLLMMPANDLPDLRYVRLSGEIADQPLLDALRRLYPRARVSHAYASTEAGVLFDVDDGLEGCPAALIEDASNGVEIRIADGTLRVRSRRTARAYLGRDDGELLDSEGFVDTGDVLELRGGRYYFLGRRGGIVNVGGLKVHPEEVEAIINRHPDVRMSLVRARKNPFTGSVVVADVMLNGRDEADGRGKDVEREILEMCRDTLPEHKIPAVIRFVPQIEVAASGKLVRPNA